jgi:hypothetical protein
MPGAAARCCNHHSSWCDGQRPSCSAALIALHAGVIPHQLRSCRLLRSRLRSAVEFQRLDAVRLYGPHAIWKDVGARLLADGCEHRTGRHEEDGCWPDFSARKS